MYLDSIKTNFGGNRHIQYSHAKYRYEIEMPIALVSGNKKPKEFEFTSQKKGVERFHTAAIKKLVESLEDAED